MGDVQHLGSQISTCLSDCGAVMIFKICCIGNKGRCCLFEKDWDNRFLQKIARVCIKKIPIMVIQSLIYKMFNGTYSTMLFLHRNSRIISLSQNDYNIKFPFVLVLLLISANFDVLWQERQIKGVPYTCTFSPEQQNS